VEIVRCNLKSCSIQYGEFSRELGEGATIDLDLQVGTRPAVVVDGSEIEPARPVHVRDLLAGRLECFSPVQAAAATAAAARAPRPRTPNEK
jgi:hypothetical protein